MKRLEYKNLCDAIEYALLNPLTNTLWDIRQQQSLASCPHFVHNVIQFGVSADHICILPASFFTIFPVDLESEGDLQETPVPSTTGVAKQEPKVNTQVSRE